MAGLLKIGGTGTTLGVQKLGDPSFCLGKIVSSVLSLTL